MNKNKFGYFIFPLTLFFTFFLKLTIGFYSEETDGMLTAMFSGALMKTSFTDIFYIAYNEFRVLFGVLYSKYPDVFWIDWFNYFFLWLSSSLISFWFFRKTISSFQHPAQLLLLSLFFWFCSFISSFIFFSHTILAFLICFSGLIGCYETNKTGASFYSKKYIFYATLFVIGYLIRPESAIGSIFITATFYTLFEMSILKIVFRFLPIYIFTIVFTSFFIFKMSGQHGFTKEIEPDIEYQIQAKQNLIPLSDLKTAADSSKYLMAKAWIVNDPQHISIEFLNSIINKNAAPENRIKSVIEKLSDVIAAQKILSILYICLIIMLLILALKNRQSKKLITPLLYSSLFIPVLIFFLTYFIKVEGRVLAPILLIVIWLNLIYIIPEFIKDFNKLMAHKTKVYFALLALTCFLVIYIKDKTLPEQASFENKKDFVYDINEFPSKSIILLDLSVVKNLFSIPFHRLEIRDDLTILVHNLGVLSLTDQYSAYLNSVCNCQASNYRDFYSFLSNKQTTYVISKKESTLLTREYLKNVYNENINYKKEFSLDNNINVYKIAKEN